MGQTKSQLIEKISKLESDLLKERLSRQTLKKEFNFVKKRYENVLATEINVIRDYLGLGMADVWEDGCHAQNMIAREQERDQEIASLHEEMDQISLFNECIREICQKLYPEGLMFLPLMMKEKHRANANKRMLDKANAELEELNKVKKDEF